MKITLAQFEKIDGLNDQLVRMGEFMSCGDPVAWIRISNRLGGALIDALGYDYVTRFPSDADCAAEVIMLCLCSATIVIDEVD